MGIKNNKGRVNIIKDADGKNLVIINDIRFKGRRGIDWKEVENYLKEYVGASYEIIETSEKIYIGMDFPDEFCHSKDTKVLKGANAKAKANATQALGELVQIATDKKVTEDYDGRHGKRAKYGWYRYDTRLALPVYNNNGDVERYNVFKLRMLVRHDADNKLYLYDFLRTKKETNSPPQ